MGISILDGGMGSELIARGVIASEGLWSAKALLDAPEAVRQVHADYIGAGARIIITNSYSCVPSYLGKAELAEEFEAYATASGKIAREAVEASGLPVKVAGSLPPLDESYRWDLVPPDEQARDIYRKLAQALEPFVDLYVCETMSCAREAANAASAARAVADKPLWVAWTLSEEVGKGLRSGESVSEAYAAVAPYEPDAFLFNCSSPHAIGPALEELSKLTDKPMGAYPNRLYIPEGWTLDNDILAGRPELSVDEYLGFVHRWIDQGATVIGGCCGIGPEYISALSNLQEGTS